MSYRTIRIGLFAAAIASVLGLSPARADAALAPAHSLHAQRSLPASLFMAIALEGTININTATQEQLELLPGVGPSTAMKILAYREKHPFKEVSHILRIKGIGRKTFEKLKPYLAVKGPTTLRVAGGG
ncbi:MAG: helix-hairpin-helix domain-containing protein [Myxococcales bacterium]|nr:helix-hairpin-helix domain-containing protein [Myxococcales bacterium]